MAKGAIAFKATGDPSEVAARKLPLTVIRQAFAEIINERMTEDPHLPYIDDLDLYGTADNDDLLLADNLHPSADANERMGQRFAARVLDEWN